MLDFVLFYFVLLYCGWGRNFEERKFCVVSSGNFDYASFYFFII